MQMLSVCFDRSKFHIHPDASIIDLGSQPLTYCTLSEPGGFDHNPSKIEFKYRVFHDHH